MASCRFALSVLRSNASPCAHSKLDLLTPCMRGVHVAPATSEAKVRRPTRRQMRDHFVQSMVPMVGFGFMDNTVMIHAGNAIDLTLGVTFGLSTMSAAACGQICSDVAGVSFGGMIDAAARRLGLPSPGFSEEELSRPDVKRIGLLGAIVGVLCGCSLGLFNLLLIDSSQKELKIAATESSGDFMVSISNKEMEDMTTLTIDGPATVGLMESVLIALFAAGCSLHEIHADYVPMGVNKSRILHVKKNAEQIEDAELESVARACLVACNQPEKNSKLRAANEGLQKEVEELKKKLTATQEQLERAQIRIITKRSNCTEENNFEHLQAQTLVQPGS